MNDKTKEAQMAEQCPAVLVNRFIASANPLVARLTFFETFNGDDPHPRTAICMAVVDLQALHEMIGELLGKITAVPGKAH